MGRKYAPKNVEDVEPRLDRVHDFIGELSGTLPSLTNAYRTKLGPGEDILILLHSLDASAKRKDAEWYSEVLQGWLEWKGISWPRGVFHFDVSSPGSGRQLSAPDLKLADQVRTLRRQHMGYQAIARQLLPREYALDKKAAGNRIRDLIAGEGSRIARAIARKRALNTWRRIVRLCLPNFEM